MKRVSLSVGAVGLLVLSASLTVVAQAPAPPAGGQGQGRGAAAAPPPTNLQVLPKDWTRQQVVQVMQVFNSALGVTCAHCHNFIGPNDPMNDFASDAKPAKNVARAMMLMVREVNPQILKAVAPKPADQVVGVNCVMCHRGAAIPMVPPPPAPPGRGGAPAAPGTAPAPGAAPPPGGAAPPPGA